jgi:hypothetical protein
MSTAKFVATDFTSCNDGASTWIKLTGDASKGQYLSFKAESVSHFETIGKTITVHLPNRSIEISLEEESYAINLGGCINPNFNL